MRFKILPSYVIQLDEDDTALMDQIMAVTADPDVTTNSTAILDDRHMTFAQEWRRHTDEARDEWREMKREIARAKGMTKYLD